MRRFLTIGLFIQIVGWALSVRAGDLVADLYSVGDGVTQTLTLAGDGTGDYENALINSTLTIGENGGDGAVDVLSGGTCPFRGPQFHGRVRMGW